MPTKTNACLCAFLTVKFQKVTLFCLNKLATIRQKGRFCFFYRLRDTSAATRAMLRAGARNTQAFLQSDGMK